MKYLIILVPLLLLSSCGKDRPECIQDKIDAFIALNSECENARVAQYTFKDRTVYSLEDGICLSDGGAMIFDENCEEICYLWGIAGIMECENLVWEDNAVLEEIIWEN